MFNIMVGNSANKDRTQCYIKRVTETHYFDDDEGMLKIKDIHLVFNSKRDYNKIRVIEKMFKRYFELEKMYLETEKKVYYLLLLERNGQEIERIRGDGGFK